MAVKTERQKEINSLDELCMLKYSEITKQVRRTCSITCSCKIIHTNYKKTRRKYTIKSSCNKHHCKRIYTISTSTAVKFRQAWARWDSVFVIYIIFSTKGPKFNNYYVTSWQKNVNNLELLNRNILLDKVLKYMTFKRIIQDLMKRFCAKIKLLLTFYRAHIWCGFSIDAEWISLTDSDQQKTYLTLRLCAFPKQDQAK